MYEVHKKLQRHQRLSESMSDTPGEVRVISIIEFITCYIWNSCDLIFSLSLICHLLEYRRYTYTYVLYGFLFRNLSWIKYEINRSILRLNSTYFLCFIANTYQSSLFTLHSIFRIFRIRNILLNISVIIEISSNHEEKNKLDIKEKDKI